MSNCKESHAAEYSSSIIVVAKRAVVSLSFLALLSLGVHGQVLPPPIFTTTSPVEDSVVMENIYNFREMTYSPFVPLALVQNSDESSHDLPENAVISHISAAINQDYNWLLGTWDPDSQELLRQLDDPRPESPEAYWTNRWEAGYLNKQVYFISRIETGERRTRRASTWARSRS